LNAVNKRFIWMCCIFGGKTTTTLTRAYI